MITLRQVACAASLVAGIAAVVPACAGPTYVVQQYDGPALPAETIAIIRVNGKDPVLLESLDGEVVGTRIAEDARLHVEVLPGPHRIRARDLSQSEALPGHAAFVARAGKVYRPVFARSSLRIFEVDRGTDAELADVTAAEPAPSPPPLPIAPPKTLRPPGPEPADAGGDDGAPPSPAEGGTD